MKNYNVPEEYKELLQEEKPVRLYYDSPRNINVGEYLVSVSVKTQKIGSIYLVLAITKSEKHKYRRYLLCLKCPDLLPFATLRGVNRMPFIKDVPAHPVFWYSRDKKARPRK